MTPSDYASLDDSTMKSSHDKKTGANANASSLRTLE